MKFFKKIRRCISLDYDCTYGCFINCTYGFFIDTTSGFFVGKYYKLTRKWVRRAGKGQEGEFISLLSLRLIMKAMLGRSYDKMNHADENF